jgi:hypothetical protein
VPMTSQGESKSIACWTHPQTQNLKKQN